MKIYNVIYNLYGDDSIIDQIVANNAEQAATIAINLYGQFGFVTVQEYNNETGTMIMEGSKA